MLCFFGMALVSVLVNLSAGIGFRYVVNAVIIEIIGVFGFCSAFNTVLVVIIELLNSLYFYSAVFKADSIFCAAS